MKKLFLLVCLALTAGFSQAQQYNLGIGLKLGASNFLGDIGSGDVARDFVYNLELADTRWDAGIFARYRLNPIFAVQIAFEYARIQGNDANSESVTRRGRNLSFTNDLLHLNAKFEWYPQLLSVADVGYRGRYQLDYQTYFFVGVGGVYNNPKAELNGEKVALRPLMTEGVKYSPIALTAPLGGGFFFTYKKHHRIGFEVAWNWTFTDYLDDISTVYVDPSQMSTDPNAAVLANRYKGGSFIPDAVQYGPDSPRGDPSDKDNFMTMSVSYSYLLRTKNSFYRKNYSWMYGRKTRWGGTKAKF